MRKKGLWLLVVVALLCVGCRKTENTSRESNPSAVTKDRQEDEYSPILSEKEYDEEKEYPYEMKVNRLKNCITVYGADDTGKYVIPVRAMICSAGGKETPLGTFQLGESSRWQMNEEEFHQYATRIVDDVVFYSAPYDSQNIDALDVEQFNRMGQEISGNSIQLEVADAKWIVENCPEGTKVEIYESEEEGPLGKPQARVLEKDDRKDPTDTAKDATKKDKEYVPVEFFGIEDKVTGVAQGCNLFDGITAQDSKQQDLTERIRVYGNVDVTTPGVYEIVYGCRNEDGESRMVSCKVEVTADAIQVDTGSVLFKNPSLVADASPVPSETLAPAVMEGTEETPAPVATKGTEEIPVPAETKQPAGTTTPGVSGSGGSSRRDVQPPEIKIVAGTRYVRDVEQSTLEDRIEATDDSGWIEELYITVQPLKQSSYYVVIYEAEDAAGNTCCVSETVQISDKTVFRK